MMRYLAFSIIAHALVAAHRSVCAVAETAAIAWDHLTAPAPLAGGDPLEEHWTVARAMREVERAEHAAQLARVDLQRMRVNLEEMQAQRDQAFEAAENLRGITQDYEAAIARERAQRDQVADGHAARESLSDAAQNLSAAQAVIEDLRRDRNGWREAARADSLRAADDDRTIARLREILRAGDHEPIEDAATHIVTLVEAAERIMRERDAFPRPPRDDIEREAVAAAISEATCTALRDGFARTRRRHTDGDHVAATNSDVLARWPMEESHA